MCVPTFANYLSLSQTPSWHPPWPWPRLWKKAKIGRQFSVSFRPRLDRTHLTRVLPAFSAPPAGRPESRSCLPPTPGASKGGIFTKTNSVRSVLCLGRKLTPRLELLGPDAVGLTAGTFRPSCSMVLSSGGTARAAKAMMGNRAHQLRWPSQGANSLVCPFGFPPPYLPPISPSPQEPIHPTWFTTNYKI